MKTEFDRDFDRWMEDPEFAETYKRERARIDAVDTIVRALDAARVARGLSKAEVARSAGLPAQSVRRFFTKGGANPTLGVTVAIAGALEVSLRPNLGRTKPAGGAAPARRERATAG